MTANAVLSPIPTPPHREPPPGVTAMVRMIRESFAVVEPHSEEVAKFFYGMLFSLSPATREMFPANMEVQRSRLLRALVHVVQMVDRPDDLIPFLRQLGRDHRKFGVINVHYEAVGTALLSAVKKFSGAAWTPKVEMAWAEAYTLMARAMQEAADADNGPAYWHATVLEHQRVSWDLAVVRLQPDHPVSYKAGQYVSVETPQRKRLWRYYSPHERTARGRRHRVPHPVRRRRLGVPLGGRPHAGRRHLADRTADGTSVRRPHGRSSDILMVAGGTGVAPMHAIIDEMAQFGENPRVHLFYGGRTREDLYDLDNLQRIATTNPWLTVVPVLESDPGVRGVEQGSLADVVTRYGAWEERDVLVCGSPAMIRSTVSRMLVAGTPLDRIKYDPFTLD